MSLCVESFGLSDIGQKRQNNEDVFAIIDEWRFFAVADGMGGHLAGEVAAQIAVESLCKTLLNNQNLSATYTPLELREKLGAAIQEANRQVFVTACSNKEFDGMGTTLSCLFLHNHHLFFGHVGDSRIYRCREHLEQLTEDHVTGFPGKKGKITKAVGTSPLIEPEIGIVHAHPGDLYLLCSDGLSDCLSPETLLHIIRSYQGNQSLLCHKLVAAANASGGHDNITVISIKIL